MRKLALLLIILGLAVSLTGCGDRNKAEVDKVVQAMMKSFDAAPEELKSRYTALVAAIERDDLLKAKASLDELLQRRDQLSPEQIGAVTEQRRVLELKVAAAAQNGDANAIAISQQLRQSRRR